MALINTLLGQPQQPMGGVVGVLAQRQPVKPQRGLLGDPDFASSLTRLGANLMAAGAQSDNTLGAIGTALGATIDQNQTARMQQAQLEALQARATPQAAGPATPFAGTGYQNQIMASRYQFHLASGDEPLVAQQKAINDFYSLNPVTGVDAEGRPYTMPRAALPAMPGGMAQPVAPAMPAAASQPDPIDQAAQAMGFAPAPTGALLPPPSGTGTPDMGMFTQSAAPTATLAAPSIQVPQMGGPKTQQALTEAAGQAQIDLQKAGALQAQEKDVEKKDKLSRARNQAEVLRNMLSVSNMAMSPQGLPVDAKVGLARFLGMENDPAVAQQLQATAQLRALTPEALAQVLKEFAGAGPITEAERANIMQVFGAPNSSDIERQAVLTPLLQRLEQQIQVLSGEGERTQTGLPQGQTYRDFINTGAPQGVDPQLWQFMTPEERRLWQQ